MAAQPVDLKRLSVSVQDKNSHESSHGRLDTPSSLDPVELEKAFSHNPFLDPEVADHWRNVYETAQYECRHVFDPYLEWTAEEEKSVRWKLEWRVCLWACIMFFALQIDRGNLSQAVSGTLLQDLGLNTDQYNYGNIIFRVSFLVAEIPSQLVSKKFGPDRWIPAQMTLWSVVAASQAGLTYGPKTFYATRSLLGILQGGFIPDLILYLSYFYTSRELPIRLSFFWTSLSGTAIISSFLAYGIFHLDGVHGIAGWRWLFLIEGFISFSVGIASFFLMPASATQTKTWFRPNGWFTDREIRIVVNRVLRDDPSKGDMHNRMAITPRRLWAALKDYDMWPIYVLGLICFVPIAPESTYFTLTLRALGFSTFNTNLLTIPSTVAGIITLIGLTWISERVNERSFVASIQNIWALPCVIALRFWSGTYANAWGTFALVTILLSYPYNHAILTAWASKNSGSVRTRSVSAAAYNICVQLGDVISSNIYFADDKPLYHRGNTKLLIICIISILWFGFTKFYYTYKNNRREKKWNGMTAEERKHYVETTKDEGNKRLDFRFAH